MQRYFQTSTVPPFNDIVFEHRNKSYGAYQIRKSYEKNVLSAFGITFFFLCVFTAHSLIKSHFFPNTYLPSPDYEVVLETLPNTFVYEKQELSGPKPLQQQAPEKGPKENLNAAIVVSNDQKIHDAKEQKLVTTDPSGGKGFEPGPDIPGTSIIKGGEGNGKGAENFNSGNQVVESPDSMPAFPGGEEAMFRFLKSKLKYPRIPLQEGMEGTVFVSFVVNSVGQINDIQILRGAGFGFDEEVIRTVEKMPSWKPGTIKGKPVSVRFKMPVKFRLKKDL